MNCRMPDLKRALESAGFTDVKTFLSSGNAAFDTRTTPPKALERKIESALQKELGKTFMTVVQPIEDLRKMLASDPYRGARLPAGVKRIVTFLRAAPEVLELPIEKDGARLVRLEGETLFGAYVRSDKGPVFMTLIEKAVGKEQTTRTWQTVERIVKG
jgi:uncharacterized protein (DUF1697 family)